MAAFTAQELQIPVRFMCEEENWGAIHDVLAGKTTFVGSEGETGKTDGWIRHAPNLGMTVGKPAIAWLAGGCGPQWPAGLGRGAAHG